VSHPTCDVCFLQGAPANIGKGLSLLPGGQEIGSGSQGVRRSVRDPRGSGDRFGIPPSGGQEIGLGSSSRLLGLLDSLGLHLSLVLNRACGLSLFVAWWPLFPRSEGATCVCERERERERSLIEQRWHSVWLCPLPHTSCKIFLLIHLFRHGYHTSLYVQCSRFFASEKT